MNPLASDDPEVWSSLVAAANPASILVAIAYRMGPQLRQRLGAEDVFQETLLKAWRARKDVQWQGAPSFRRWLISIAERCIEDQRDREYAQKRDAHRSVSMTSALDATSGEPSGAGGLDPWSSTTPSRIAEERERMRAMEAALDGLPGELREVVRLRLFEDLLVEEVAVRLGLGESAVRHRFRKGAELYRELLRRRLGASSTGGRAPVATDRQVDGAARDGQGGEFR